MHLRSFTILLAALALPACALGTISPDDSALDAEAPGGSTPLGAGSPRAAIDGGVAADTSSSLGAATEEPVPEEPPADAAASGDAMARSDAAEGDAGSTAVDSSAPAVAHDTGVVIDAAPPPPPPAIDSGVAIDAAPPPPPPAVDSGVADVGAAHLDAAPAPVDAGAPSGGATTVLSEVTFYGWPDNTPAGPAISNPILHKVAGGIGTYDDPITFATDLGEWAPGTLLYLPFLQRYVIMEDTCVQCASDWASGKKRHIDVWMNSDATHVSALTKCQDDWTRPSVAIEAHPPPGRPVGVGPLFDPAAAVCRASP